MSDTNIDTFRKRLEDSRLFGEKFPPEFVSFDSSGEVELDGYFTVEQLRTIINAMESNTPSAEPSSATQPYDATLLKLGELSINEPTKPCECGKLMILQTENNMLMCSPPMMLTTWKCHGCGASIEGEPIRFGVVETDEQRWGRLNGGSQSMKAFEVWAEGWQTNDGKSTARLLGRVEAMTFQEACDKVCGNNADYNRTKRTLWACRLFDNEVDARRFCG